ncbi:MAG: hypothetical protein C0436_05540 [Alphaproteobacteria bacterium]|nr:hypothetical protein [Alphaproteobacteria bacterium]
MPTYPNPQLYAEWQDWARAYLQVVDQDAPDSDLRASSARFPAATSKYNLGRVVFDVTTSLLKYSNGSAWRTVADAATFASYVAKSGDTMTGNLTLAPANLVINNTSPTVYLQDTDHASAVLHVNGNFCYILSAPVNSLSWAAPPNGRWPLTIALLTGDVIIGRNLDVTAGSITAAGQINGSRFGGGPGVGSAAYLTTWEGNSVCFAWGTGFNYLRVRINESHDFPVICSVNNTWMQSFDWGGTWSTGILQTDGTYMVHFPNAYSDERFKENIQPTQVDALAAVLAVEIKEFEWNEDGLVVGKIYPQLNKVRIGVVAQQALEHVPEMFEAGPVVLPDGTTEYCLVVRPEQGVPYLIKAMQQQQELIAKLEARIAALENANG